jgi:phospholipase/carboxylesterase
MPDHGHDRLLDAITELMPALLGGLEALRHAGRHLHPPELALRAAEIASAQAPLAAGLERFRAEDWPAGLADFRRAVDESAERTLAGLADFVAAPDSSNPVMAAYRALGQQWRALEALYPVAAMLPPVGRYFLNDVGRADQRLAALLAEADHGRADVGVMHAANETSQRGGFSLYVPEYQRADDAHAADRRTARWLRTWPRLPVDVAQGRAQQRLPADRAHLAARTPGR